MKKLPIKELCIDDETGVSAIALVNMPAIEVDFMLFSNSNYNISFAKIDLEKKELTGPAMIPDKNIYRYNPNTNEEFYVYFSKETVATISQRYLMEQRQANVNLEHSEPLDGISLVESWIVKDPKIDKSTALGYDVPEGTWMITMKINNDKFWEDVVKTGAVKGFSIEGFFVEKFSRTVDMTDDLILEQIKKLIDEVND